MSSRARNAAAATDVGAQTLIARALPIVLAFTAAALVPAFVGVSPAHASHCTSDEKLRVIHKLNDGFWNYDFETQDVGRCNIGWPMDLRFENDAEINKVKNRMEDQGYRCRVGVVDICSNDQGRVDDGVDFSWDSDGGGKKPQECYNTAVAHFRIYSAGEGSDRDRMYNLDWGFYVLGTSHIDSNECGGSAGFTWHGWSELSEEIIRRDAEQEWAGNAAHEADADWHNEHGGDWSGNHLKKNDEHPTKVRVP
jgi:hypothetical protein